MRAGHSEAPALMWRCDDTSAAKVASIDVSRRPARAGADEFLAQTMPQGIIAGRIGGTPQYGHSVCDGTIQSRINVYHGRASLIVAPGSERRARL